MSTQFTGTHLKELREAAGMTIDELTAAVGMKDRRSMFRWHHSEWILGGKALVAVQYFYDNGRDHAAAMAAIAQWKAA